MNRVLVTGGTGGLGREIVHKLLKSGYIVRVMSRRSQAYSQWPEVEWIQADLATGVGLNEAVADVDTIIHAATDAGVTLENATLNAFLRKSLLRHDGSVDIQGTKLLLEQAHACGVAHCIYISIVGVEHIPFAYYRHKLAAEAVVRESKVPWSIVRATQFHSLLDIFIRTAAKLPVLALTTDFQFQPVDPTEVAGYLCAFAEHGPNGRCPDFGGPEVLTLSNLARTWLDVYGSKQRIIHVSLPGKTARTLRQGGLTSPFEKRGTITWAEWLLQHHQGNK
jgi:uncharacterized protein YbjT (DUF2867 family)